MPGRFKTTWQPKWSTNGIGNFSGRNPANSGETWQGRELISSYAPGVTPIPRDSSGKPLDTLTGTNACANTAPYYNYFYIYADPPTCRVSKKVFERGRDFNLEIELYNPNAAPMDIDSAYLDVKHGSDVSREAAIYINGQQLTASRRRRPVNLRNIGVTLPTSIPGGSTEHIKVKSMA